MDAEYVSFDSVVPDVEEDFDLDGPTLDQRFYDRLSIALAERVKQCGPKVPVVTGRLADYQKIRLDSHYLQAFSAQFPARCFGK